MNLFDDPVAVFMGTAYNIGQSFDRFKLTTNASDSDFALIKLLIVDGN